MNDREQLLHLKHVAENLLHTEPVGEEQYLAVIQARARIVRVYYEALLNCGFPPAEALFITAHAKDL